MADFIRAYRVTAGHEGGYANDPDDRGGETYRGVARKFWPAWEGWELIDGHKAAFSGTEQFKRALDADARLQQLVLEFYKREFWDQFQGDAVPSQEIAEELFDTGVNMSTARAVAFLQDAMNLFNHDHYNRALYADVAVDGRMGPATLAVLQQALAAGRGGHILLDMNVQQGMHYREQMKKLASQEKFALGWYNRVALKLGAA